jgi:hypothetical protein
MWILAKALAFQKNLYIVNTIPTSYHILWYFSISHPISSFSIPIPNSQDDGRGKRNPEPETRNLEPGILDLGWGDLDRWMG